MVVIEQLFSAAEVADLRQFLDEIPWLDGRGTAMGMAADVKSNAQADASDPRVKVRVNQLLQRFGEHPLLVSAALPQRIFPPCFNRYRVEETYGFHVDGAIMRLPDSSEVMRSDLSMTVFLSEPDEYEGGELQIATEFGTQSVKLPAGHAVLYPSSSLHQVTPVLRGERLAAICWMQSLVADGAIRRSLFELDQSIQALSALLDTPRGELDRLHSVYHNLIRQFAQL